MNDAEKEQARLKANIAWYEQFPVATEEEVRARILATGPANPYRNASKVITSLVVGQQFTNPDDDVKPDHVV